MYEENTNVGENQTTDQTTNQATNQATQQRYYDYSAAPAPAPVYVNTKPVKEKRKKEPGQRGFFKKAVMAVCLGLFFGMCAGLAFYGVILATKTQAIIEETGTAVKQPTEQTAIKETNHDKNIELTNAGNVVSVQSDISDVVEEVMPAMVSIINQYTTTGSFFGQRYTEENEASGSGIVIGSNEDELLVVTNYHVAAAADKLKVTFIDGTVSEAKIKGVDSEMDLAVLAIPIASLSEETKSTIAIAKLGDSDALKLGEPVIAIGNALGYGQSVTDGIVSALNRELEMTDGSKGVFIQTNAAINPGNSGGALLNIKGEVIGINSSKIGGSNIDAMGYAIPINAATPIIDDLKEYRTKAEAVEEENAGYMGVVLQDITNQVMEAYNMPSGVFVYSVEEGSAAENAGIMARDIITKLDGEKVKNTSELKGILKYYAAGETIRITFVRQESDSYEEHQVDVVLGKRPQS